MQLPTVLPDESLFSRICRHLAIGELSSKQAQQQLIGDGRAAIHPYLTSNLGVIAQFTSESPKTLLLRQTLRPLFSYYLPKYRNVIENTSSRSNDIIRASQLSTFRSKERLAVKHCPLCAKDDIYEYGAAYWHLIHQVPGVEACAKHRVWLVHNELPTRSHVNDHLLPDVSHPTNHCSELAHNFAAFVSNKIQTLQPDNLSLKDLNTSYLRKLNSNGSLTKRGRIKRKKLTNELFELSEELFLTKSGLSLRSQKDYRFVSSLLSGQYPQHPFKHLMLEFYLSCCDPINELKASSQSVSSTSIHKEEQCCGLLKAGLSMAAVSRRIKKSRCYVKNIALKNNIPVNLKPNKITIKVQRKVVSMAYKGFHRAVIAQEIDISIGSVEQIITATDRLVEWRKKCRYDSLKRRHQCKILRYCRLHPSSNRQEIKQSCEAAFFWLYFHCPDWLESHLPVSQKVRRADRVNWNERDELISQKITAILELSDRIISRTELDRMLGAHGWLTSKKDKLPLTLEAYYEFYAVKSH